MQSSAECIFLLFQVEGGEYAFKIYFSSWQPYSINLCIALPEGRKLKFSLIFDTNDSYTWLTKYCEEILSCYS